jgi:hypothetical protein
MPVLEALNTNQRSTGFNLFSETRHWLPNHGGLNSRNLRNGCVKIIHTRLEGNEVPILNLI